MKNCQKCGKEIKDEAVVCPECGCEVKQSEQTVTDKVAAQIKSVASTNDYDSVLSFVKDKKLLFIGGGLALIGIIIGGFLYAWVCIVLLLAAEIVSTMPMQKIHKIFKQENMETFNSNKAKFKADFKVLNNQLKSKCKEYKYLSLLGIVAAALCVIFILIATFMPSEP